MVRSVRVTRPVSSLSACRLCGLAFYRAACRLVTRRWCGSKEARAYQPESGVPTSVNRLGGRHCHDHDWYRSHIRVWLCVGIQLGLGSNLLLVNRCKRPGRSGRVPRDQRFAELGFPREVVVQGRLGDVQRCRHVRLAEAVEPTRLDQPLSNLENARRCIRARLPASACRPLHSASSLDNLPTSK